MVTFWNLVLLLFFFIPAAILWFRVVVDIFDRRDLSGILKVAWLIGVFVLPLLGALAYLMTRPVTDQDRERAAVHSHAAKQQQVAAGFSIANEIEQLDNLRSRGVISQDEFDRQRTALLA